MSEFPYDREFNPPMPVCRISLTYAATGRSVDLPGIMDSGADGTIVPLRHLRTLGARRSASLCREPAQSMGRDTTGVPLHG